MTTEPRMNHADRSVDPITTETPSKRSRSGSTFETVVNLAVLIAAVFVIVYFARLQFGSVAAIEEGPRVGSQLVALEGHDWATRERTLVLALRADCVYCEASMPFYKRLAALSSGSDSRYGLLMAFPDQPVDVDKLKARVGLDVPSVASADLSGLGVDGTPTLIWVDNRGTVLEKWVGQLPAAGEQEVIQALQAVR